MPSPRFSPSPSFFATLAQQHSLAKTQLITIARALISRIRRSYFARHPPTLITRDAHFYYFATSIVATIRSTNWKIRSAKFTICHRNAASVADKHYIKLINVQVKMKDKYP